LYKEEDRNILVGGDDGKRGEGGVGEVGPWRLLDEGTAVAPEETDVVDDVITGGGVGRVCGRKIEVDGFGNSSFRVFDVWVMSSVRARKKCALVSSVRLASNDLRSVSLSCLRFSDDNLSAAKICFRALKSCCFSCW
jgi:hypothetical protein